MDRYVQRIISINPVMRKPLTQRIALAVIDAAHRGILEPTVSQRIMDYVDEPFSYYYGEPAYSLYDRFMVDTTQLHTKSGLLNMLALVELAGGYVSREHYGCLAPKGVSYRNIKKSDAMSIMTKVSDYKAMLELEETHPQTVLESDEYYWEEHECYKGVR